ncbi:MFS transporter [Saccharopolyspora spinosa]|uniref:MFS family arabinose efflux permease n=1 Tax=Saccharopolyspora spinosa TaxID=60894 RepID=A0A2N3Y1G4_SACSN|nr:MFS transporter [Saccharopolyspora spinosa]PKW16749.1 putative MFS family arabinose efflux permease [Saccharopolyspora spinosa]
MGLKRQFWILWLGTAVNRVGLLVPGFLGLYLVQREIVDRSAVGLIVGLYGAGLVSAGLIGGVLSDRFGARRTIIAAQLGSAVNAVVLMLVGQVAVVGALVYVAGFLSTINRPASAGLVVTVVEEQQRARAYGLLYWAQNIGGSAGPVLAGLFLSIYPPGIFLLWAVTSIGYAAFAWALPEDAPTPVRTTERRPIAFLTDIVEPFRRPVMAAFLCMTFLLACVYLQRQSTLPLGLTAGGLSTEQIGMVLAINPILVIVLQPVLSLHAGKLRGIMPFVIAALFVAVGFGMNAFGSGIYWVGLSVAVWTLGEILQAPMTAAFIAARAPEGRVGSFQGSYFFIWNLGLVIGGPIGTLVSDRFGFLSLWVSLFVLGVLVSIGYSLIRFIPGYRLSASDTPSEAAASA